METKINKSKPQLTDLIFSVPGKVFLIGEYAVLAGSPALVAAVAPRFSLSSKIFAHAGETRFHPQSPAGLLCSKFSISDFWWWRDPVQSSGGFGASTAQFSLISKALGIDDWRKVLQVYRDLSVHKSGVAPSGADLVAQILGGVVEFYPSAPESEAQVNQRETSLGQIHILVIQASLQDGRKTATHDHLAQISQESIERLQKELVPILQESLQAFSKGDARWFGSTLLEYADVLSAAGYEIEAARVDRQVIAKVQGVLGVKGTGALQSDALIVVIDSSQFDSQQFNRVLQERNLRLWSERLIPESGIRVDS